MTRLFNLESCVECYQYARLFNVLPEQLIPERGALPRKYKNFIQHNANVAYLPEYALVHNRSQELEINPSSLDLFQGTQLNEGDDRLFIIRDTVDLMTLATGGFLSNREKRLYASAYHYWNHISEFSTLNFTRPLVIIDLDSFGCDRLQPISFAHPENSSYPVPILDTKHKNLLLKFDAATTYEYICQVIARQLLSDRFPSLATDSSTVSHLAHYLQKISFIQYIQLNLAEQQELFNLIIEISHLGEIFLKNVTVQVSLIQKIILQQINTQQFNSLANKYPEIQFALVSHYPVLAQMQTQLPDFILIKSSPQDFKSIWSKKKECDFPLFGFYLDQIEFKIKVKNEDQWIQVSSQDKKNLISYEGEKKRFIGFIPSTGQNYFVIRRGITTVRLPIRVNGQDYCVNGVPQDYYIEIGDNNGFEDIQVSIEFNLQPDSTPELIVRNFQNQSRLKCELKEQQTLTYSYIPYERITSTRQKESEEQINRLQLDLDSFRVALSEIIQALQCRVVNYTKLVDLFRVAYQQVHRGSGDFDALQFINASSDTQIVKSLIVILESTDAYRIFEEIPNWLTKYVDRIQLNQSREMGELLKYAIMFLGKTYNFSHNFNVEPLFSQKLIKKLSNLGLSNEYTKMLARVAVTEKLHYQYFGLFTASYKTKLAYHSGDYLWGYWRILRWYYNYKHLNESLDYSKQFKLIVECLLEVDTSQLTRDYKANAFSSLIYLLTFREFDSDFCRTGSEEMKMAAKVVERFRNDQTIKLNQISRDKLLNKYFEELIAGIATESDMKALLSAD